MRPPDIDDSPLDEGDARRVLLVRCVEAARESPLWTAEDRRWAGRAASQALGDDAPRARWLAERARLALQRLAPRDAALRRVLEQPLWRPRWPALAVGAGALVGLMSDALLAGPYFNLLSPPFYALLAWNLALYAGLAWQRLRGGAPSGPLRRGVARGLERWLRRVTRGPLSPASHGVLADFALRWAAASRPLTAARAALLLHLAGAALALGLVAGMYARALVFDYRAGWATTLLDASVVHALLSAVFAPAQMVSGLALPDAAGIAALRVTPATAASASAAPWLHLMAITLGFVVLLPRMVLAALAGRRAAVLERAFPLALDGAAFERLRPATAAGRALRVLPHAAAPAAETAECLERWLVQALGEGVAVTIAEPVPYGDEEAAGAAPAGPTLVLFDLATTPEDEVHGRLLRAVGGHPPLLLDETGFVRRFGSGDRLAQRRAAWQALADALDVPLVAVDLDRPAEASAEALRAALER